MFGGTQALGIFGGLKLCGIITRQLSDCDKPFEPLVYGLTHANDGKCLLSQLPVVKSVEAAAWDCVGVVTVGDLIGLRHHT